MTSVLEQIEFHTRYSAMNAERTAMNTAIMNLAVRAAEAG